VLAVPRSIARSLENKPKRGSSSMKRLLSGVQKLSLSRTEELDLTNPQILFIKVLF